MDQQELRERALVLALKNIKIEFNSGDNPFDKIEPFTEKVLKTAQQFYEFMNTED
jgi:hypothetical protein